MPVSLHVQLGMFAADILDGMVTSMMLKLLDSDSVNVFAEILHMMKTFEQKRYLNAIIAFFAKQYFDSVVDAKDDAPIKTSAVISAAAALIRALVKDNESLKESLVSSMTKSSIQALDDSLFARRSVIAAIAQDEGK